MAPNSPSAPSSGSGLHQTPDVNNPALADSPPPAIAQQHARPEPPPNRYLRLDNTPTRRRSATVRIRRLPSAQQIPRRPVPGAFPDDSVEPSTAQSAPQDEEVAGRRRSLSEPHRPQEGLLPPDLSRQPTAASGMQCITEERSAPGPSGSNGNGKAAGKKASVATLKEKASIPALKEKASRLGWRRGSQTAAPGPSREQNGEYDSNVVDMLDLVDPQVRTLNTLTNVQNSLFVPDIPYFGRFLNRQPTYDLRMESSESSSSDSDNEKASLERPRTRTTLGAPDEEEEDEEMGEDQRQGLRRSHSITSVLTESHYAVLPHRVTLEGWTDEDKAALDDHVRHQLHSRRSAFKRGFKGFLNYIRRPLGFFVTLYAFLITVFGLVWVLFLIGWVSGGSDSRDKYLINVVDNVLVALFAIMGDGLAPFRAVDTYHMCFIANYAHKTWRLREEKQLPELKNKSELPTETAEEADVELAPDMKEEYSVLTPVQQKRLQHHQAKFAKSHTFYKPHETETHHAFSIRLLIAIVVLLDFHSIFQIALGTCTWSINYKVRPEALTTVILCCSIACNITGGVLISIGDKRSRKKDVIERMFRQTLTQQAIKHVGKKRQKPIPEIDETPNMDQPVDPGIPDTVQSKIKSKLNEPVIPG